jgi:hypothetical protein
VELLRGATRAWPRLPLIYGQPSIQSIKLAALKTSRRRGHDYPRPWWDSIYDIIYLLNDNHPGT